MESFRSTISPGLTRLRAISDALTPSKYQVDYICAYMKHNLGEGPISSVDFVFEVLYVEWAKVALISKSFLGHRVGYGRANLVVSVDEAES